MKSTFIFASFVALVMAIPVVDLKDPCTCESSCLTQLGPDCECKVANLKQCMDAQKAAGQSCPRIELPKECPTFTILPIETPEDPCACDYVCLAAFPEDCYCKHNNEQICYDTQVSKGLNCPARSIPETCASLNLPPIGPGADITTRQAAPSAEGEECGGEKSTPCSDGLICKKNNDKFLLSPGICKAVAYLGDKCGGEALTPCFTGLSCDLVNPKFLLSPGVCVEGEAIITR